MASIKRNIVYNILLTTSQVAFALITLPYISRVLGPHQLGRVSFADSATQYFIICASLGIPVYGIREIAKVKNDRKLLSKTFSELLMIQLITTLILFVVYFFIILFANRFRAEKELFYLGLVQLMLSGFVTDWLFQGMENYRNVSVRAFTIRLVSIVLILVLVKDSTDIYLYYTIWSGAVVINVVMTIIPSFKYLTFKNLNLKQHFKPIITFFSTKIVTSVYVILLSFFVGYLQDKSYVAYFTSAYKICTVSLTFILAFSSVMIPKLSDYFHNNRIDDSIRLLSKNFNVIINYSIPLMFMLIFFAGYAVRIILGPQFESATADLIILSPLILIVSISNIYAMNVLTPIGRENEFLKATFIGMIVNLLLVFLLIPIFKDRGAAITLLITETVVCVLVGYYSRSYIEKVIINYRVAVLNIINCFFCFGGIKYLLHQAIHLSSVFIQALSEFSGCAIVYLLIQLLIIKDPFMAELFNSLTSKISKLAGKQQAIAK